MTHPLHSCRLAGYYENHLEIQKDGNKKKKLDKNLSENLLMFINRNFYIHSINC